MLLITASDWTRVTREGGINDVECVGVPGGSGN